MIVKKQKQIARRNSKRCGRKNDRRRHVLFHDGLRVGFLTNAVSRFDLTAGALVEAFGFLFSRRARRRFLRITIVSRTRIVRTRGRYAIVHRYAVGLWIINKYSERAPSTN